MKLGIIGAGQLAQMMALAANPLGIQVFCLAESIQMPASPVSQLVIGDINDPNILKQFAEQVDVITFENENIDIEIIQQLAKICPVFPNPKALYVTQDRLLEKDYFTKQNIPTVPYQSISSYDEFLNALNTIGTPAICKTRRFGYDGKGQHLIQSLDHAETVWQSVSDHSTIIEGFIEFDYEVSLISVRNKQGDIRYYPLVKNQHKDGILRLSLAPFKDNTLQAQAENYAKWILDDFNYVGILTIEFFVKDQTLYANEIAPRVHNSGHWTIEGAVTSQFENHIRAVCGLPLGSTHPIDVSAMINFIGSIPSKNDILALDSTHFYDYAKQPRHGRKLGHVTVNCESLTSLESTITKIKKFL